MSERPRILVLSFSQTGRVQRYLSEFLQPLQSAAEIHQVALEPVEPFPFPWGFFRFFGIFPETVLGMPSPTRPLGLTRSMEFDGVIIAFPVWFLSAAQPVQAFLRSNEAQVLHGKPVLAFVTCRELWHEGMRDFRARLLRVGGRLVDQVIVKDSGSSWLSYFDTPLFLITGKRLIDPAEREARERQRLQGLGQKYASSLQLPMDRRMGILEQQGAAVVSRKNLLLEMVGKMSFRLWANLMHAFAPPQSQRRRLAICLFFLYLCVLIPFLKLSETFWRLLAFSLFRGRMRGYVSSLSIAR
jgi:hypothetical protein